MSTTQLFWDIPAEILNSQTFDKIRIMRHNQEQGDYSQVALIESKSNGIWVNSYVDGSAGNGTDKYYLIKFNDSIAGNDTQYYLTFFPLTPRELRLIEWLKGWLPATMMSNTSQETYRTALKYALSNFNVYPPETNFTIDSFPTDYEGLLIMSAQITFCMYKYLGVGIKDFNYSDMGLSLTIDRGEKIRNAMKDVLEYYNKLLELAKMNFMHMGVGLGTSQLPVGVGGNLGRGAMNILDIFQSFGR